MIGRIKVIINVIKRRAYGALRMAKIEGMQTGKNVRVMGGVDFGSEPYLITLGDDITISFNVHFVTHDGGTWAFRDLDEYKDVHKFGRIRIGNRSFVGGVQSSYQVLLLANAV